MRPATPATPDWGAHLRGHLLRFDTYEIRRAADTSLIAPDQKTGFCLGDRFPIPRAEDLPMFRDAATVTPPQSLRRTPDAPLPIARIE